MSRWNRTRVTGTSATTESNGFVDSWSLFYIPNKVLDFISKLLMFLRESLERHFPKLVVMFLFLPFVVALFVFGLVARNLGS